MSSWMNNLYVFNAFFSLLSVPESGKGIAVEGRAGSARGIGYHQTRVGFLEWFWISRPSTRHTRAITTDQPDHDAVLRTDWLLHLLKTGQILPGCWPRCNPSRSARQRPSPKAITITVAEIWTPSLSHRLQSSICPGQNCRCKRLTCSETPRQFQKNRHEIGNVHTMSQFGRLNRALVLGQLLLAPLLAATYCHAFLPVCSFPLRDYPLTSPQTAYAYLN